MEVVVRRSVLAPDVTEPTRGGDAAEAIAPSQQPMSGHVDAIEQRGLIDVLEEHEGIGRRRVRLAALSEVAAPRVDEVVNPRHVAGRFHAPDARAGVMQVDRAAEGVGHLRLQIDVADVAIAVADEIVHQRRHRIRRPHVALVEIRRPRLPGESRLETDHCVRRVSKRRRQIQVEVGPLAISRVEGRCIGRPDLHGVVVALHGSRIGSHEITANPEQAGPLGAPARLPFAVDAEAILLRHFSRSRNHCSTSTHWIRPATTSRPGGTPGSRRPP